MGGMGQVHWSSFRSAWTAWAGVSLVFVAANFGLALGALLLTTGLDAQDSGLLGEMDSAAFVFMGVSNLLLAGGTSIAVIGAAAALVIASRRGAIARLALAGATPGQVRRTLVLQLAAVTLVCAVLGDLVAAATVQWFTDGQLAERGLHALIGEVRASRSLSAMVSANLLCVGVALLGGFRQATLASRISPVEALRPGSADGSVRRVWATVGRWVLVVLGLGVFAAMVLGFRAAADSFGDDAGDMSFQLSMLSLVLASTVLALAAPVTVELLTVAWTRLVPGRSATWLLARSTVLARRDRLVKSVVPTVFAIALLFGMIAVIDTLTASMRANGYDFQLSSASFFSVFSLVGTALLVAVAGSVGSLVMMSKQRDSELALAGIAGATPAQRLAVPALEAVIIAVTAVILGLVATAAGVGFQYWAIQVLLPEAALGWSPGILAGVAAGCLLVTVAATVLPTIPALRRPAPAVVARLVAE